MSNDNRRAPRRALVLEDQAVLLLMMEDALSEAGYQVHAVATGPLALAAINEQAFDVAVLDVNLESGNSLSVADALSNRAVPFIFSTGSGLEIPIQFKGIPVLQKPFMNGELLSAVRSVIAQ